MLQMHDRQMTEAELFRLVKCRRQDKQAALRDLVSEGVVCRSGTGKRGDPFLYSVRSSLPIPSAPEPAAHAELLSPAELENIVQLFQLLRRIKKDRGSSSTSPE